MFGSIFTIFFIIAIGYIVGRVQIKGLSLGSSGVLLAALVAGHFGAEVPSAIKNIGLVCFVGAVGVIAGPVFFNNFKQGAIKYILLGILTVLVGAACCAGLEVAFGIPNALCIGMFNGALTSTPGLAAALEATGGDHLTSIGYGIAYPFGVVGVVLFVQLIPKFLGAKSFDGYSDAEETKTTASTSSRADIEIDPFGFCAFSLVIALGFIIGNIKIPLGASSSFSLGSSGGPLIVGLIVGHFGKIGPISIRPQKSTMNVMREFGLVLFLLGAGCEAGHGFIDVIAERGVSLFMAGAVMTLVPMFAAFIAARTVMKMRVFDTLGSICGGMTSTPALGTLIAVAGTDAVAASYAATYPIALIMVVLSSKFMAAVL